MKEEDRERLELESIVIHHESAEYDITGDNVYFPINHRQLRDLLGKLLTQLDAMGLPERVYLANKAMLTQTVWRWWDEVYSNATTSSMGCIAPVICKDEMSTNDDNGYPSNRWGYKSEEEYVASVKPVNDSKSEQ